MAIEIPNYTLLSKLGEGAMAEVWLAEHKRNKRRAAIKVLKPAALSDAEAEKLFLREGEVLAGFADRNIVTIFDNDRIGDLAYIAMELLPGGTLLERMQRGPIKVGEAIGLVVQIASALEAAHRQQVIHRDLKPANIMLRDETTPVLTDFGAVRVLDRSTIYGKDGGIIGTPIYMSPEQITGQPLTGTSDLYALGVMFHELLTGRLPFPGGSIQEIATQHLYAPIPRLPPAITMLQPVLDRLLAKKPEDRYPTAQALIDGLREVFISDEALRWQIGYSGTSMAWSSQLKALGFMLDPQQKDEVRRAQGEFLGASGTGAAPRSEAVRPVKPASAKTPSRRGLWLGLAGLVAVVGAVVLWPRPQTPVVTDLVTEVPPVPAVSFRDVFAARDNYVAVSASLVELAQREKLDITSTTATAEALAQQGVSALDAEDFAKARDLYAEATSALKEEAVRLLTELETNYASLAQAAVKASKFAEAEQLIARGKAVRTEREEWGP